MLCKRVQYTLVNYCITSYIKVPKTAIFLIASLQLKRKKEKSRAKTKKEVYVHEKGKKIKSFQGIRIYIQRKRKKRKMINENAADNAWDIQINNLRLIFTCGKDTQIYANAMQCQ